MKKHLKENKLGTDCGRWDMSRVWRMRDCQREYEKQEKKKTKTKMEGLCEVRSGRGRCGKKRVSEKGRRG